MSVYKPLTTSDVIITPFKVNKNFTFQGASALAASNVGIDRYIGKNLTSPLFVPESNPTGYINNENKELVYKSIKHLYYSNFISGSNGSPANLKKINTDNTITIEGGSGSYQPMYDNYLSSTLKPNRQFPTGSGDIIGVISIPSNLFGETIKPGTLEIEYTGSLFSGKLIDDGEGNVFKSIRGGQRGENLSKIGDIIYQHGIIILTSFPETISNVYGEDNANLGYTNSTYGRYKNLEAFEIIDTEDINISFQSTMTIYESQYKCTFSPNEFVNTTNPSSISGSQNTGVPYEFTTKQFFEPYITTVGLYNRANELIAVGKLSQPLQSSNSTDTTILVNLDL